MGASTFSGPLRVGPKTTSAGVTKLVLQISVDPTAAAYATGYILPKGAVITGITSLGGATGGTAPTIDVGIAGSTASIANELDADTAGAAGTLGASGWTALAANTEIWAGVGSSAATGGTTVAYIEYYMVDSKNGANN